MVALALDEIHVRAAAACSLARRAGSLTRAPPSRVKEALILAEASLRDDPTNGNIMVTAAVLRASLHGPNEGLSSFADFLALMSPVTGA